MSAACYDNIQILKAVDDRQQQNEGRKLWISAHQLLNEISGTFSADPRLMPGFLQELFIAQAAGQLTWRLMDQNANPRDANYYPVSAPFLREARLHPLIEAEARPQFMIPKLDQAVFTSLKAVEIRVRTLGGYRDQAIGVDLMNRAFAPNGPLTDSTAPKGERWS